MIITSNKKIIQPLVSLFIFLIVFTPLFVQAAPFCPTSTASPSQPTNFTEFVCILLDGINLLVPVVIGFTLFVFLWGLAKFILASGDEKNIQSGKDLMVWGVIGLFVMVSVWGIVNIVYGSFFSGSIGIPVLQTTP